MRPLYLIALFLLITPVIYAVSGQVPVKGYFRKNGTYVQPHYRSTSDQTAKNNWGVKANFNKVTGKAGTVASSRSSGNWVTNIDGYTRKDGRYVRPYYRSRADWSTANNRGTTHRASTRTAKSRTSR